MVTGTTTLSDLNLIHETELKIQLMVQLTS